ncbi:MULTISPECIES: WXG100 family type VII secretion target [unclassified Streptococcus]|uniref:WXG100 family type VII secretion target n=1 Tax=unclassified Streptococcus TaxID=2608887 RepID=UPI0010718B30|nr:MULTISPECIES: WXG100 family type VII secretion target [unclassified Streptococcus]MBF0787335.1 WXG100 family type VII secretion target [Streptococcus sp. 19428wC2_LYSM12]MCQ9211126.1 WXG100 family type VII secretion target [Streptococcus sp. B01]MCQ9214401.1 WXG100 family type VII secretion target [Streptococcus sp. O1]TFV05683.1 WXG100 family type VII secretion target [Streptococcus sp. LYSM12]
MSGQIRVSPEMLKIRAKEYGRASNDIHQMVHNLQRLQDTLRSEWEGEAFNGFDSQFNELKPKVQNFAELMQQINLQLDKTADIMRENDLAIRSGFGLHHG